MDDADFLQLSGLQHFAFCRRQWALIHVEGQWAENLKTVEGGIVHARAHDPDMDESRGDLLVIRGLRVASRRLRVSGACDVVEFRRDAGGVPLHGRRGLWLPMPVEYKRGAPKEGEEDVLQLAAQAICLEEMFACEVPRGALYYDEPRRRLAVDVTPELREKVSSMLAEMNELMAREHTPRVKPRKGCASCSLVDICLPRLTKLESAAGYVRRHIEEDEG